MDIEHLKYPLGRFKAVQFNQDLKNDSIKSISTFPSLIRDVVRNLDESQLDTEYRPGGWTVRQVVHHCADSHMNAFIRFKLALTESQPTIKGYNEAEWAKMSDYLMPIVPSLELIKLIHNRWINVLENMDDNDFDRTYYHSEYKSTSALKEVLQLYAWHSNHHLAHIVNLIKREGWDHSTI